MHLQIEVRPREENHPWRFMFHGIKLFDHQICGAEAIVEYFRVTDSGGDFWDYCNAINVDHGDVYEDLKSVLAVNYAFGSGKTYTISLAANIISPNNFVIFTPLNTIPQWMLVLEKLGITATSYRYTTKAKNIVFDNMVAILPRRRYHTIFNIKSPLIIVDEAYDVGLIYKEYPNNKMIMINRPGYKYMLSYKNFNVAIMKSKFVITKIEHDSRSILLQSFRELDIEVDDILLGRYYDNNPIKDDVLYVIAECISEMKGYLNVQEASKYPISIHSSVNYGKHNNPWLHHTSIFKRGSKKDRVRYSKSNIARYHSKYMEIKNVDVDCIDKRIDKLLSLLEEHKNKKIVIVCRTPQCLEMILDVSDITYLSLSSLSSVKKISEFRSMTSGILLINKRDVSGIDFIDVDIAIKYGHLSAYELDQFNNRFDRAGRTTDCTIHYIN